MKKKVIVKLGEKVQIKVGQAWYSTIVERLEDESVFFISPPLAKLTRVRLEVGQTYTINTISDRGLYEFDVCVLEMDLSEKIPMAKLEITSEPRRNQRRNAFRIDTIVDVNVREPEDADKPDQPVKAYQTHTLNISESGMLFVAKKSYPEGMLFSCDIMLNKFGMDKIIEDVKAEVVWAKYPDADGLLYQIGVDFKEIPKKDKRDLTKFIMLSQRTK